MRFIDLPILGRTLVFLYRLRVGLPYALRPPIRFLSWLITSKEYTNYTYDLDPINKRHMAAFVAEVTGVDFETAFSSIMELEQDERLRKHIQDGLGASAEARFSDLDIQFGRRLGWYAVVRAVKPRVVVETGVDKGLGACVITSALKRNTAEGSPGEYFGTDINPRKGYLLSGEYASFGRILYGDSVASLRLLDRRIDVFINDSDHSSEYERLEYETIADKLSERAIILGDNWPTDELLDFALRTRRRFLFFREQPRSHWYPGDGIAAAFGSRNVVLARGAAESAESAEHLLES